MLMLLLTGCGRSGEASDYVIGKTFVYENEGFYGDFTITVNSDGTFSYCEGFASSYIGMGNWTIEQDTLTLKNEEPILNGSHLVTNLFEIRKKKLIWREDGSDNFSYVKLKDGETFREK